MTTIYADSGLVYPEGKEEQRVPVSYHLEDQGRNVAKGVEVLGGGRRTNPTKGKRRKISGELAVMGKLTSTDDLLLQLEDSHLLKLMEIEKRGGDGGVELYFVEAKFVEPD